jgi:hypothetical protein
MRTLRKSACSYDPEINRTYSELAQHYGAVVIPARVATPTDKPKVEVSVQIAQRWVLAALRHQTFFTLADLNAAIAARVDAINARPMQGLAVSRRTLFEQVDRSDLSSDGFRLDSEPIVHGHRSFCLHLRVPLCRLNGDVAEQKRDLIEPDAGGCRPMSTAALTHPRDGHRAHGIANSAAFSQ